MERSSRAATSAFCSRRFSRFSVLQSREQPCGGSKITFALSNGYVSAEQRPFFPDHAASRVSLSYNQLRSCEVGRNLKPRITCECYTACYHVVHGTLLSAHSLKRAARCPVNFGPYDLSGISVFFFPFSKSEPGAIPPLWHRITLLHSAAKVSRMRVPSPTLQAWSPAPAWT